MTEPRLELQELFVICSRCGVDYSRRVPGLVDKLVETENPDTGEPVTVIQDDHPGLEDCLVALRIRERKIGDKIQRAMTALQLLERARQQVIAMHNHLSEGGKSGVVH